MGLLEDFLWCPKWVHNRNHKDNADTCPLSYAICHLEVNVSGNVTIELFSPCLKTRNIYIIKVAG